MKIRFHHLFSVSFLCAGLFESAASSAEQRLAGADSWTYQLQAVDIDLLAADPTTDLVVIDYSQDGSPEGRFSRDAIQKLKSAGKIPAAYFCIGEAEDYRGYWDSTWNEGPPPWLGPENPDWPGNFLVRYWHPQWKEILFEYLRKISEAGFEVLYLDKVDAWYDWVQQGEVTPVPQLRMIELIDELRIQGELLVPGGLSLIIQNGETVILEEGVEQPHIDLLLNAVEAVATEDLYFPGDRDMDNDFDPEIYRFRAIEVFKSAGKKVFSVEYLTDAEKKWQFYRQAINDRHIPVVAGRELDRHVPGLKIVEHLRWMDGQLSFSTVPGRAYRLRQSPDLSLRGSTVSSWTTTSLDMGQVQYSPDLNSTSSFIFLEIDFFPAVPEPAPVRD